MMLQIELEAQDLQVLEARAAALGVPVERAAADTLRRDLRSATTASRSTQSTQRQLKGFGAAAHLAPRAADVNRDRCEEVENEIRRAA